MQLVRPVAKAGRETIEDAHLAGVRAIAKMLTGIEESDPPSADLIPAAQAGPRRAQDGGGAKADAGLSGSGTACSG